MPSGVFDLRGAERVLEVRRAPRGEKTPLGAMHRRPQQKAGEIGGLNRVWCAQPGRRGEVYARQYEMSEDRPPEALGEIEVLPISAVVERCPWIAAEALDLGEATRAVPVRSSAEALLHLAELGAPADAPDPLYVEGPPVHRRLNED